MSEAHTARTLRLNGKSLRNKLCAKKTIKQSAFQETKIIILSDDIRDDINDIQEEIPNCDEIIKKWTDRLGLKKFTNEEKNKYETLLATILHNLIREKTSTEDISLKSIISNSQAKDQILNFDRKNRQIIYKRLQSLVFNLDFFDRIFKDKEVKKITITESLRIKLCGQQIREKKINIFFSKTEVEIFKTIHAKKIHPNGFSKTTNNSNLYIDQSLLINQTHGLTLRRKHNKASNLLELMRDKLLTIESGNYLIKYLNKGEGGLLIAGDDSTGKTKTLSALISSLSNTKLIAITNSNEIELASFAKDYLYLNRATLSNFCFDYKLDYLADQLSTAGIKFYVADDASSNELALAWLLKTKHNIPSVITFSCKNSLPTLLHHCNTAIELLNYQTEKEYFFWNISRLFLLAIDLNSSNEDIESRVKSVLFKNGIMQFSKFEINQINGAVSDRE